MATLSGGGLAPASGRPMNGRVKGTATRGLVGATAGFFVGFAAVSLFGPLAHRFQEAMGLTPVMVAFLVAMPALTGSLLRIPFGAWVDTTGGRKPFLILLVLSLIGMTGLWGVIVAFYPERLAVSFYPLLLLLAALSGCGIATFSVGIGQVSYWFPQRRQGWALGAYAGLGNIAPGLFAFLLPLTLAVWGLAGSYFAWMLLLAAGIVGYSMAGLNAPYFQLRREGLPGGEARGTAEGLGQEIFPAGGLKVSLAIAARRGPTWALVAIYFTTFGGFIALTAWFPTYWMSFFGLGIGTAGALTAIYSIGASVIRVAGGSVSDRLGGENTAIGALALTLVGALVLTASHRYELSVAGSMLMAAGMGIGNAAVFKLVPQVAKDAVGGAAGWVGGLGAFGGFAIPPVMGAVVQSRGDAGYATGFVVFVGLSLVSLLLAAALRRRHEAFVAVRTGQAGAA